MSRRTKQAEKAAQLIREQANRDRRVHARADDPTTREQVLQVVRDIDAQVELMEHHLQVLQDSLDILKANRERLVHVVFHDSFAYETRVEDFRLSTRAVNALKLRGINTVGDLVGLSEQEVGRLRGVGKQTTDEIVAAVQGAGLLFTGKE